MEPLGTLNLGVGGDRTQHVLWRMENGTVPPNLQVAIIHCGTNNLSRNTPADICRGIAAIAKSILGKKSDAKVIVTGLFPRGSRGLPFPSFTSNINEVNCRLYVIGAGVWPIGACFFWDMGRVGF